ncbi:MAG: C39 family peptidase [Thermodesulfobacteriota bacterium]
MEIFLIFLLIVGLVGGEDMATETPQGEIRLYPEVNSLTVIRPVVKPLSDILDDRIIRQEFDYSCGSAALSTLLNFYLGEKLSERQVIHGLLRYGDSEQIAERRAFSLLDMKKFVTVLGYKGVGYKAEITDLEELGKPCILPIKVFGYRHFTVFKGIYKGHVFLADPWKGHSSYTLSEFKDIWYENVLFVVYPEGGKELDALRLKESDLRFIDEDTTFYYLFRQPPLLSIPERQIDDIPGTLQYYKRH